MESNGAPEDEYTRARMELVRSLEERGIVRDDRILSAFWTVPRHVFVPAEHRALSYQDRALPLIEGQTISQPTMLAIMLEALACEPGDRALEVGGGCGYAAALLSHLVAEVHTIEVRPALSDMARRALREAGIRNVTVHTGDGWQGLPDQAPFERILVSAAADALPEPLLDQLKDGGRIAIPLDEDENQVLKIGRKAKNTIEWQESVPCVFVPLEHR